MIKISVSKGALALSLVTCFALSVFAQKTFGSGTVEGLPMSYLQPDAPTFAIWSLIYAGYVTSTVAQFFQEDSSELRNARPWMALNYLTNGLWLCLQGLGSRKDFSFWLATFDIILNGIAVLTTYRALGIDYSRQDVKGSIKITQWLPISLNAMWILLANLVNFSNILFELNGQNTSNRVVIGGSDWAIGCVFLASLISVWASLTRVDLGVAFIAIWALFGIYRRQTGDLSYPYSDQLVLATEICIAISIGGALLGLGAFASGFHTTSSIDNQESDSSKPLLKSRANKN